MEITKGKIKSAQKVVIYGPEGIGKSTFAAQFPNPVFIDTEGSTKHLDVSRTPTPPTWTELMTQVGHVCQNPDICKTLVIDTIDWAEILCVQHVCERAKKSGIEDFGYGKGYMYLGEDFAKLLDLLNAVIRSGINVVLCGHAKMRKFEQPDEMGAYDRWEMKMSKHVAPLVKEWADMVLFANYETFSVKNDSGRSKGQGGKRVLLTSHHPCWDAKNRHSLPDKVSLDFKEIAQHIEEDPPVLTQAPPVEEVSDHDLKEEQEEEQKTEEPQKTSVDDVYLFPGGKLFDDKDGSEGKPPDRLQEYMAAPSTGHAKPPEPNPPDKPYATLYELMRRHGVFEDEIRLAVHQKGYYPQDMPVKDYDQEFVKKVLVDAWPQVYGHILEFRDVPF